MVKVEVILQLTVSQPCLGVRHPSGTIDQFFFLLEFFFRQLRIVESWYRIDNKVFPVGRPGARVPTVEVGN
jgi:hypothetical protein